MHAPLILHDWLEKVLPQIHPKRVTALSAALCAVLNGGKLSVTGIGRAIGGAAKEKHNIKRADRLLSNKYLQAEKSSIYAALSELIIAGTERPLIVVDWSAIDQAQQFSILRASTPLNGRTLTLYEEVHEVSTKEKPKTHYNFLNRLKKLLPKGCRPIVVSDAGFKVPWFKQVRKLGWDYVGRVRSNSKVRSATKQWLPAKSLYSHARGKPKNIGTFDLTKCNKFLCNFVTFKAKPKGRIKKTKAGKKAASLFKHTKREKEPWLLATSLSDTRAKSIVQIYRARMQIEESFRDTKNARYGFGLELTGTYKKERLAILVLLGAIATTFAWLLGKATEILGNHRHFQANSVSHKKVISTIYLGIRVFQKLKVKITQNIFHLAELNLKNTIEYYACKL